MLPQDLRDVTESLENGESWVDDTALDEIFRAMIDAYEATTEIPESAVSRDVIDFSPIGTSKASPTSSEDEGAKPTQTRIRTYTARKREIEDIMKEIPQLESYIDFLKHKVSNEIDTTQQQLTLNACLRDKALQQQYLLARMQAAMTLYVSKQQRAVPFDSTLHLGVERSERLLRLTALRPRILQDAKRFVMERSRYMNLGITCKDQAHFVTPDGDYCSLSFGIWPLKNVIRAKDVFDLLLHKVTNVVDVVAQCTGDVVVQEEALEMEEGINQVRVVRTMPGGLQVESNLLVLSQYVPHDAEYGDGRACGVIVVTSIDQDDLFPYCSQERLRQDVTSIYMVKTYTRKVSDGKHKGEERAEVVVTRASFLKLHHTELTVSIDAMLLIRDRLALFGDNLLNILKKMTTR